jgi:hypothetical protein
LTAIAACAIIYKTKRKTKMETQKLLNITANDLNDRKSKQQLARFQNNFADNVAYALGLNDGDVVVTIPSDLSLTAIANGATNFVVELSDEDEVLPEGVNLIKDYQDAVTLFLQKRP